MPRSTRVFRVFVSSTFLDMRAERAVLHRHVFPRLRRLCAARGAQFHAIDLRWGIAGDAAAGQLTMRICREEIQRCQQATRRPNFIALLGDRYGWRPLAEEIPAAEFEVLRATVPGREERALLDGWYRKDENAVPPLYLLRPRRERATAGDWSRVERTLHAVLAAAAGELDLSPSAHRRYAASATEQEIDAGILQPADGAANALCFIRTLSEIRSDRHGGRYFDTDPSGAPDAAALALQERLKQEVRAVLPPEHRAEYAAALTTVGVDAAYLAALREDAYARLSRMIQAELDADGEVDPVRDERQGHEAFRAERSRYFTGRGETLRTVAEYVHGTDPRPLVLHGPGGSGKSSLMAAASIRAQAERPDAQAVHRFIGATAASASETALLEGVSRELCGPGDDSPAAGASPADRALARFRSCLSRAARDGRPVILFIDALDQLATPGSTPSLAWIPSELPPGVRMVVSTLPGATLDALRVRRPAPHFEPLPPMPAADGARLLDAWLAGAGRTLQPPQREAVLQGFRANGLPLYLRLAFEAARRWPSYQPAPRLGQDVSGIVRGLFRRLSSGRSHGPVLPSRALGYLVAARDGLAEDELMDVLSRDAAVMRDVARRSPAAPRVRRLPAVLWARLHSDLEPYLVERGADGTRLLAFFHRQFGVEVAAVYLPERTRRRRHAALARYFAGEPLSTGGAPNLRKLNELPYQQARAGLAGELRRTLLDAAFIQAKVAAAGPEAMVDDYDLARAAGADAGEWDALELVQGALRLAASVLEREPDQLASQLWARLSAPAPAEVRRLMRAAGGRSAPWPRPVRRSLEGPGGALLRQMRGHSESVETLAIGPGDRLLASGSLDRTLRVWDLESGGLLHVMEHPLDVNAAAFSPDGQWLLSAGADDTLRLWNVEGGALVRPLPRLDGSALSLAMLDGRRALVGGWSRTAQVWDLERDECLATLRGPDDAVRCVAVAPGGTRVFAGALSSHDLWVWDLARPDAAAQRLPGHGHEIWSAGVSADGRLLATGSRDRTARVWDAERLAVLRVLQGHTDTVRAVAFAPDGERLVSGSADGTVRVWRVADGECTATLHGHAGEVRALALTADGTRIVSAGTDGGIRVWRMDGATGAAAAGAHGAWVSGVAVSADGRRAVSASGDGTMIVWDPRSGAALRTLAGPAEGVTALALCPDGRRVVTGEFDGALHLWSLDGEGAGVPVREPRGASVRGVAVTPDGRRVVAATADGTLEVWELRGPACLRQWRQDDRMESVAMAPDGRRAVTVSGMGTLQVWDLERGDERLRFHGDDEAQVATPLFTPDGRRVVAGFGPSLSVWSAADGRLLRRLADPPGARPRRDDVTAVALAADGRHALATAGDALRTWDLRTGAARTVFVADAPLLCCALTPDGGRLICGDEAGGVHLLSVERAGPRRVSERPRARTRSE